MGSKALTAICIGTSTIVCVCLYMYACMCVYYKKNIFRKLGKTVQFLNRIKGLKKKRDKDHCNFSEDIGMSIGNSRINYALFKNLSLWMSHFPFFGNKSRL